MTKQVLLIDRDKEHAQALQMYIGRQGYEVLISGCNEETVLSLDNQGWGVIIVHPGTSPETADYILGFKTTHPLAQIIVMAPKEDLEGAMAIFKIAAIQYLEIPVCATALDLALSRAEYQTSLLTRINRYTARLEDLHLARNAFNQLFEEVPCYISVQDKNLRITAANRRFKRDFGSFVGGFCHELYKQRDSQGHQCPVEATFKDGKSRTTEEIVTAQDGKQYNVLTQTAPIRNSEGEIAEVMEMSTNITQIRQLQDHLVSLGLMLGSVSHGVKGMLTALDGGIYHLEAGLAQDDHKRMLMAAGQVKEMSDKIKKMVLAILYYAKSRELQYETKEAEELARNVVNTVSPLCLRHGVTFSVAIAPGLGPVEVDAQWMEASLVNFLENAVDACLFDQSKQDHRVEFTVEKIEGKGICFTVSDDGIGMDAETKNKMFTLFFSSKGSRGTGLGLFIAHRVIKYHGGLVEVESEPGKGSRFTIHIPFKKTKNSSILTDQEKGGD